MGQSHGSMSVVIRSVVLVVQLVRLIRMKTPSVRTPFSFERVLEGEIFRGIYPSHISEKI